MDMIRALAGLSALGQETRLSAFRTLAQAGPDGLLAGEISARTGALQNTMSTHLAILQQAGLISSRREGRSVRYFADMNGMEALLAFLLEDCCGGRPDLCRKVLAEVRCACA